MNSRFLLIGTIATAVALFVWQSLSNAALPWHTPAEFTNDSAVVNAIRANTAGNDAYAADQGVFAIVSFRPDMADKSQFMGPMLAKQFAADVVLALGLCFLFLALRPGTTTDTLKAFALIGLSAALLTSIPNAIWYGLPADNAIYETIDLMLNGAIAGLVLGAVHRRFGGPARAAQTAGVRADGGLRPSDASRTTGAGR